ncbi:hypothetical protein ALC53_10676 [Atta colombica]|uniref:Gustatory receptor n=1 Tax=Atta colombica TaxID=520822 RepID=A0A151I055_9HYME|nr:hypothetical protein ALC53_10676 [Atta colombica]
MLRIIAKIKMRWHKRWLCYATDFRSLMYPCFICSRILGIFPYKFNISTFEFSKSYYILSTIIICILCVINLVFIDNIIKSKLNRNLIWIIHAVIYYVLTSFIVIITHFLSGPRMRLLQTIMEVSLQLFSLQLLHRKNIFSMKGLTIDATLLAVIVGNITTYLLIFIQFLNMSHSCDREAAINVTQTN